MKRLLTAFFMFTMPLLAQTIQIQNPSFEVTSPLIDNCSGGACNVGPIPSWTISGIGGSWQPGANAFSSVPDGKGIAWIIGSLSEDLGIVPQPGTTYTLSAWTGHRADQTSDDASNWVISLYAGSTQLCMQNGAINAIPRGTFVQQTLTCPVGSTVPPGDLIVTLSRQVSEAIFDDVTLTYVPTVPPVTNPVTVQISATYDDGSIPTILSVGIMDVTANPNVLDISLTPDPTTGAASGSFTLSSTETYEVILYVAGKQVGQTSYQGNLVQALMPQISQANFSVVLLKATGAVKSFTSSAQ